MKARRTWPTQGSETQRSRPGLRARAHRERAAGNGSARRARLGSHVKSWGFTPENRSWPVAPVGDVCVGGMDLDVRRVARGQGERQDPAFLERPQAVSVKLTIAEREQEILSLRVGV